MENIISKNWIIQFRWYLAFLALGAVIGGNYFNYSFESIRIVLTCIFILLFTNYALRFPLFKTSNHLPFLVALLDLSLISLALYYSGGATNPFSILFLVYVVFSAILLKPFQTGLIVALSILAFGGLLQHPSAHHMHHSQDFSNHLWGMWLAYSLVAVLCSVTISVLANLLKKSLTKTEQLANKQMRLSSLTTLAAGAAHELRTPINTIALCVEDAKILLEKHQLESSILEQLNIISTEISRCTKIIKDLGVSSGEIEGENFETVNLKCFIENICDSFSPQKNYKIKLNSNITSSNIEFPIQAIQKSLIALIQNSIESTKNAQVSINSWFDSHMLFFEISDNGPGIKANILEQLGEPFVTSKPPGKGMGLGVFLAKLTANMYGGSLNYYISPEHGTKAILSIRLNK